MARKKDWRNFPFRPMGKGLSACFLALLVWSSLQGLAAEHPEDRQLRRDKQFQGRLPIRELSPSEAIVHALNRLGFGPRPGELEHVRQMGLETWVERQLNPGGIDDSAVATRLKHFPTLRLSSAELLQEFPPPRLAAKRAREATDPAPPQRNRRPQGRRRGEPMQLQNMRAPRRVVAELSLAKLTRAIHSERQLQEMMVDFWFNHFNVFAGKGADRWLLTSYERDAIRPRALGKFPDLLLATAKSPAMLFYLDNWLSADPGAFDRMQREFRQRRRLFGGFGRDTLRMRERAGRSGRAPRATRRRGLNENYARELMELHTLGVDGGYTQQDVTEVARCFTGWTIRAPRRDPRFHFAARLHNGGPKTVLGRKILAGGIQDGEEVLRLLASHPSTARFLSTKLARRFVADEPPPELVERMARTFLQTGGDIRAVLRTMIYSPEFWWRRTYRAKVKKPFELVASTARAAGLEADMPLPLLLWTARIGEPLYRSRPPTGYPDQAEAWVNTGALLNRLNFALALTRNRLRGLRVDLAGLLGEEATSNPQKALARSIEVFLSGQASRQTRAALEGAIRNPLLSRARRENPVREMDFGSVAGLVLGSPDFQRR